jgi:hypothetical protein
MKNLLMLFLIPFAFASCNKTEAINPVEEDVIVTTQQGGSKALFTITVQFQAGSCTMSGKAKGKLHSELDAIKAQYPNMALVQVTGHHWEGNNLSGVPFCQCRADAALSYFNRWAATANVGQSFGITTCQTHIHSGPENQVAVLVIDAFL